MRNYGRFLALAAVLIALPAAADWLVMRDGALVETDGGWEVRGRQVVFTLSSGTLSSLRLSDVDLDASAEVTSRKRREVVAEPAPPPAPRPSVLVLTDEDVGHVDPSLLAAAAGDGAEAKAPETGGSKAGGAAVGALLQVVSWSEDNHPEVGETGLTIRGTVKSLSSYPLEAVSVWVMLYGDRNQLEGRVEAEVARSNLPAGETSRFEAVFSGVLGFERVEFRLLAREDRATAPTPSAATSGEDPGAEDNLDGPEPFPEENE